MKLSIKMMLLFSAMMLLALLVLSSYAANTSVQGANAFTQARFRNMSSTISWNIQTDHELMEMAMRELTDNTSFMAALNQIVRDDSADHKMGEAAGRAAMQQLMQSPLVDTYYRVTFYTRDGIFLTSYVDEERLLTTRSEEAKEAIGTLYWLDEADISSSFINLSPHTDIFTRQTPVQIYGIAQAVKYHGQQIGYLEIAQRCDDLLRINEFIDNKDVSVQLLFEDGTPLFTSEGAEWTWPKDITKGEFLSSVAVGNGSSRTVLCNDLGIDGLTLYISQDSQINIRNNGSLRWSMFRRALYILIPTLALIAIVSMGLTRSVNRLTKKVQKLPVDRVLDNQPEAIQPLSELVTSHHDTEVRQLEKVFNDVMLRLHDTAINNLTLREGTLQAQLSALQTQINPHFIYNTLNIISAKSMESGNFDVIEICDQFAQMLRYSTDTRSRTATMAEEIENVRNYLMLAKARYEENLEFVIDVPDDLTGITVPKLTLQPIVENALTHGFDGKNVLRRLSVTGRIENAQLILEIRDNGTGFSDEMLHSLRSRIEEIEAGKVSIESTGGHIGLVNTCLRLHYYSKGTMRISIRNENGAVITMTMPCEQKENPA